MECGVRLRTEWGHHEGRCELEKIIGFLSYPEMG